MAGDLNVVLLDVLECDDDALVEADVGEDLPGAGADTRHRATLRRLGRVVDHRLRRVLGVVRVTETALRLAGGASQRRLHTADARPFKYHDVVLLATGSSEDFLSQLCGFC